MSTYRVGFLGAGNMARALVKALLEAQRATPDQILASDINEERLEAIAERFGIHTTLDNAQVVRFSDILFLSVKPQVVDKVLPTIALHLRPETLVVSIVAGVPLRALEARLPQGSKVIRTMPNTPAMVLAGATALSAGEHVTAEEVRIAKDFFKTLGRTVVLDETLLDAVTGLSGSGPAYAFTLIQAMADAGVKSGLARDSAVTLAAQTVLGSAKMVLQGQEPIVLRGKVASPAGTTIDAIHVLEKHGFSGIIMDAIEAAFLKSRTLGGK